MSEPRRTRVRWASAFRALASRHPPIRLFERVTRPDEWEAVVAAEMLTNPRVRQELGELQLVPPEERVSGPGATWVMASFTHPRPSRFSDGRLGVYYAAASLQTAVREYAYHLGNFYRSSRIRLGAQAIVRCLVGRVDRRFVDIRGGHAPLHDPNSYVASQAFGAAQRAAGESGIVYDSVRDPGGQCVAAFRPRAVAVPRQGPHLALHFDGERMDRWADLATGDWQPV